MTRQVLRGARVLLEGGLAAGPGVLIEAGRILGTLPEGETAGAEAVTLPPGSVLAPGFIDAQANGGGGVLFNDQPTAAGLAAIAAAHRRGGTTGLLPTLITDAPARLHQAAAAVRDAAVPGVLGVHFEGPFLNPERAGVHDPSHMRAMGPEDEAAILALAAAMPDRRVLLTLAPELAEDAALARLAAGGVILAAGHTVAGPERLERAAAHGLRGFTHVFNAMPPIAGRAPGPAAAAMLDPSSWCGVIADGIHVHPALLRLLIAAKPPGRVFLVTDAMPPLGTAMTEFALGGRRVLRRDGRLCTEDGTLAGADLDMAGAVRNAVALAGLGLEAALRMASAAPAAFLRLDDERGRIAPGCRADLVLLSPELTVLGTCIDGAWQAEGAAGGAALGFVRP